MRYDLPIGEFYQLPITSGTVQNTGNIDIEITDVQTVGAGIVIEPWEKFSFHGATLYAYAKSQGYRGTATINVVPFEKSAGRWDLEQIDNMSELMQGVNKIETANSVKSELGIDDVWAIDADGYIVPKEA